MMISGSTPTQCSITAFPKTANTSLKLKIPSTVDARTSSIGSSLVRSRLPQSVFPLGCRVDRESTVQLSGWNLKETNITVSFKTPGVYSLPVPTSTNKCQPQLLSTPYFAVDTLEESLEAEPNEAIASARVIPWPCNVNGRIDRPGDVDVFRFEGSAGQEVMATRRSPTQFANRTPCCG